MKNLKNTNQETRELWFIQIKLPSSLVFHKDLHKRHLILIQQIYYWLNKDGKQRSHISMRGPEMADILRCGEQNLTYLYRTLKGLGIISRIKSSTCMNPYIRLSIDLISERDEDKRRDILVLLNSNSRKVFAYYGIKSMAFKRPLMISQKTTFDSFIRPLLIHNKELLLSNKEIQKENVEQPTSLLDKLDEKPLIGDRKERLSHIKNELKQAFTAYKEEKGISVTPAFLSKRDSYFHNAAVKADETLEAGFLKDSIWSLRLEMLIRAFFLAMKRLLKDEIKLGNLSSKKAWYLQFPSYMIHTEKADDWLPPRKFYFDKGFNPWIRDKHEEDVEHEVELASYGIVIDYQEYLEKKKAINHRASKS